MDSPNLIIAEVSDDMSATNHVAPQCKNVQDHLNTASVLPDEQNYDKGTRKWHISCTTKLKIAAIDVHFTTLE